MSEPASRVRIAVRVVAVVALVWAAGCRSAGQTADEEEPSVAESVSVADGYGYRGRVVFSGALSSDRPDAARRGLARSNLGLAMAVRRELPDVRERLADEEPSESSRSDEQKRELERAVELAEPYRDLDLEPVRAVYRRVAASGAPLVLAGTYHPAFGPEGPQSNTLAFVSDGRLFPVFVRLEGGIEGFLVGPERRWVAVVTSNRGRMGVAWLDLEDFEVTRTAFDERKDLEWLRVGWGRHAGEVRFWGEGERRVVVGRCSRRGDAACKWGAPGDRQIAREAGRRRAMLTKTHGTWFRSSPVSREFFERFEFVDPHPRGRLVVPSVRRSPDERHVAYVTVAPASGDETSEKRLWVEHLASGRRRVVAGGDGWFAARWLGSERLAFDASPVSNDEEAQTSAECDEVPTAWETRGEPETLRQRRCRLQSNWSGGSQYIRQYDLETRETAIWSPSPWATLRTPNRVWSRPVDFKDWPDFVLR